LVERSKVLAKLSVDGKLDSLLGGHTAKARAQPTIEATPSLLGQQTAYAL
jgi:hypothetical protein